MQSDNKLRVALVAGEASGDELGAGLIAALGQRLGDRIDCVGVAGPAMRAAGCEAWFDAQDLAVMGLAEVVSHLPRLLRLRRQLRTRLLAYKPDVFIGIDAPDFNIPVEKRLHRAGIATVHYVSPSVWAWRPKRAARMTASTDLVFCLLPFEPAFYANYNVRAEFVGHPLADKIPLRTEAVPARRELGLDPDRETLAVMPGSRHGELKRLGPVFAQTIKLIAQQRPGLQVVVPVARPDLEAVLQQQLLDHAPGVPVTLVAAQAQRAIAAADAVLVASGTATLEALLIKRPMVVAYQVAAATRFMLEKFRLLRIDHFALPNLLADKPLVPEVIQDDVTAPRLAREVTALLDKGAQDPEWLAQCDRVHNLLRRGADKRAADGVIRLMDSRE